MIELLQLESYVQQARHTPPPLSTPHPLARPRQPSAPTLRAAAARQAESADALIANFTELLAAFNATASLPVHAALAALENNSAALDIGGDPVPGLNESGLVAGLDRVLDDADVGLPTDVTLPAQAARCTLWYGLANCPGSAALQATNENVRQELADVRTAAGGIGVELQQLNDTVLAAPAAVDTFRQALVSAAAKVDWVVPAGNVLAGELLAAVDELDGAAPPPSTTHTHCRPSPRPRQSMVARPRRASYAHAPRMRTAPLG